MLLVQNNLFRTGRSSVTSNRITKTLNALKRKGKKALVSYIVNGDPRPDSTLSAMHTLVENGVDIIELGVPFSDPMAEGVVIQRGHERALKHNTSLSSSIEVVNEFRKTNIETPVVLMGYANPIERMGYERFAKAAQAAGVDGLLTVDLPPEEAEDLNEKLKVYGIENIFLVAPTSTENRMQKVVSLAGGFVYYVSLKGVTGAGHLDVSAVKGSIERLKKYTDLPVLAGFGIKDADSAKAISEVADGVIVGSALVSLMSDESSSKEDICDRLASLVKPMREALDTQ